MQLVHKYVANVQSFIFSFFLNTFDLLQLISSRRITISSLIFHIFTNTRTLPPFFILISLLFDVDELHRHFQNTFSYIYPFLCCDVLFISRIYLNIFNARNVVINVHAKYSFQHNKP